MPKTTIYIRPKDVDMYEEIQKHVEEKYPKIKTNNSAMFSWLVRREYNRIKHLRKKK